jgi:hypothetical protein
MKGNEEGGMQNAELKRNGQQLIAAVSSFLILPSAFEVHIPMIW